MSNTTFNLERLSDAAKIWRNMNNFTIAEMAELCGMATSTYGFVEQAQRCPTIAEFAHICDTINMPVERFFKHGKE